MYFYSFLSEFAFKITVDSPMTKISLSCSIRLSSRKTFVANESAVIARTVTKNIFNVSVFVFADVDDAVEIVYA